MQSVTVVFTNGNIVHFQVEEFEADLKSDPSRINRYPYKDARGNDSAIYLKPNEVAGVFLLRPEHGSTQAVATSVPGS